MASISTTPSCAPKTPCAKSFSSSPATSSLRKPTNILSAIASLIWPNLSASKNSPNRSTVCWATSHSCAPTSSLRTGIMQREMDKGMPTREPMVLLVSDDAVLCAAARLELETRQHGLRVAAVSTIEAARRIVQDSPPSVILLEENSVGVEPDGPRGKEPLLDAAVSLLAVYAPVVVLGMAGRDRLLSEGTLGGAADYVARTEGYLPVTLDLLERRLRQSQGISDVSSQRTAGGSTDSADFVSEDFGEVLRHELNNPLTGILGNAELLLAEVRREPNGKLPQGGQQRIETIAALAVRLRETVRRLSLQWDARHSEVPSP